MIRLKYIGRDKVNCVFGDFVHGQSKPIPEHCAYIAKQMATLKTWKIEERVKKEVRVNIQKGEITCQDETVQAPEEEGQEQVVEEAPVDQKSKKVRKRRTKKDIESKLNLPIKSANKTEE